MHPRISVVPAAIALAFAGALALAGCGEPSDRASSGADRGIPSPRGTENMPPRSKPAPPGAPQPGTPLAPGVPGRTSGTGGGGK
jgi:hypothetical protein